MIETLMGQVEKILFEDEGFFIAVLKDGEKVSGTYFESEVSNIVGSAVTLKGNWQEHKKYGKTFKFDSIKVNQSELFFFLNKIIKGFTKKLSAELIEKFGAEELVQILDNDIERLLEFNGIKEKRLKKIQSSWKQFRSMREFGEFLSPYDVSPALLTTIATAMKDVDEPCTKIKNNPYILTSINSIGFKRADELALKMGVPKEDENRIGSAMDYVLLNYCEQQGNSCVAKDVLFHELNELLGFRNRENIYEGALVQRVLAGEIVQMKNNRVSPARLYDAEKFLYDTFKARAKLDSGGFVKDLDAFLACGNLNLGTQQKEAVEMINKGASLLFLVGYAGTGKSTTSKTILDLLNTRYETQEIMTCALSGIASQRIADTTGYESATIQSLLVKHESRDTFPYAVMLIDEASMINSSLFARFLAKVNKNAILIIVGDDAQLPPIGAGNVLSDALTLNIAPIVKLTKIYRQSEEQAITLIANEIRVGNVPEYRKVYEDFEFIDLSIPNYYALKNQLSSDALQELREENSNEIVAEILHKVVQNIDKARLRLKNKEIKEYLNYFQVITPMKGGTLGSNNLNKVLQEYFNPNPKKCVKKGGTEFRLMDKVVHTKNENMTSWSGDGFKLGEDSAQRRIFNGMSGLLFKIEEDDEQVFVFYPNEDVVVLYEYEELKSHLMLSYALTIHKVQGMEYDIVVIPMSFTHFIMHNTKLIYTAITRAKHKCILIGEGAAFESACRKFESTRRDTVLLEL
ncbi:MAG: AAA family ATPase [Epsilonproteobacteria bacterium]|nr:AAA family ATPase [Campylobacterota bacterium]PIP09298.1 MAG: ATPase [Sulfurimonas sp. CG23_combo_of_CG06-09_8_20_14_all_36_33]PIS24351.1 MAG: ATPase [Sulfurimonas sp. CG08_land_8_20_14_0_20_36_33]PIU34436.1 MAG: ATPase [Sulfurimonas sp. CG07_land_8_20_14_0_80_36_56]PIV03067.1 MAG: ATPase [Sulfurimonas sp. CG03_land_8_20_14_0_80_36_25]PIV34930.1 MAG: ATPase [Sulfurimonas sp. CG02_land_8_20_14_3_00_36_67]PIV61808.1 MAG: ATPase [Sulfurimonas sp. CG01_land_8_20_14_3_00_36_23]PIW25514.1 MAG: 